MKLSKVRKSQWAAIVLIVAALTLGACMNRGGQETQGPENTSPLGSGVVNFPSGSPTATPGASPSASEGTAAATPFDWLTQGKTIETRINQLSEISGSTVVVDGQTALVGVTFTPQYQGALTERIREMVAGLILAADPQIQTVAVTSNSEDTKAVGVIASRLRAGEASEAVRAEFDRIVRASTTLK